MPSLVLSFVPQYSSHRVISGSCSHVSLFLRFTGAAVVFLTFETMALAVAIPFHEGNINGSSGRCGGAVGSSSSFGEF